MKTQNPNLFNVAEGSAVVLANTVFGQFPLTVVSNSPDGIVFKLLGYNGEEYATVTIEASKAYRSFWKTEGPKIYDIRRTQTEAR